MRLTPDPLCARRKDILRVRDERSAHGDRDPRGATAYVGANCYNPLLSTHWGPYFPNIRQSWRRLTLRYLDVLNIHRWRRDTGSMRTMCALVTVVLGVGVIPGRPARAQVRVEIAAPTIRFEVAPPLVVVSPG